MKHLTAVVLIDLKMALRNPQGIFFLVILPVILLVMIVKITPGNSIEFLTPGMLGFAIMSVSVLSIPVNFLPLRDKGMIRKLEATPLRKWIFILGQIITTLVFAMLEILLILGVATLAFGFNISGNVLYILASILASCLAFIAFGFALGSIATNAEGAVGLANLFIMPMAFMGGVFAPVETWTGFWRVLSKVMPLTYSTEALRGSLIGKINGDVLWKDIAVLLVYASVCFIFAIQSFTWYSRATCSR